jgi:hypothetical protein
MQKPKVGDIFEIPLSGGRRAYGQFLDFGQMGPIIQVFDLISNRDATIEEIQNSKPLFPPVITGLFAALRDKVWKVIGNRQIPEFVQPKFVSALYDERTGEVKRWSLWDGRKFIRIGDNLPPEYRQLEYLVVWNPADIVDRIETGKIPYPYEDLVRRNRFTPAT